MSLVCCLKLCSVRYLVKSNFFSQFQTLGLFLVKVGFAIFVHDTKIMLGFTAVKSIAKEESRQFEAFTVIYRHILGRSKATSRFFHFVCVGN